MTSSCLCDQCSALCCRYFVLEIDKPETRRAYDDIRWYLIHENVFVFIEKKKWYLGIYSRCKHLQPDNRCGIYETRPKICREYSTDNCDYHGGEYDWDILFSSAEQLEKYGKEQLAEERAKARKRSKKREASSEKKKKPKTRRSRLPKLRPSLMLGPARAGGRNGNGNGRGATVRGMSLPVLRG
jgi:Fe-S-cluster containining protein